MTLRTSINKEKISIIAYCIMQMIKVFIIYAVKELRSEMKVSGVRICEEPIITSQFLRAAVTSYAHRISEKQIPKGKYNVQMYIVMSYVDITIP